MKILYVSRSNSGNPHPFVKEQADVLMKNYPSVSIKHFLIHRGGIGGYFFAIIKLSKIIKENDVSLIHVHYGISALAVVLNKLLFLKKYKIIITFHGSDINKQSERKFSLLASRFASHNIVVSEKMINYFKSNYSVIPCGIDTDIKLGLRNITRQEKEWEKNDFVVLFSSSFNRKVKDPEFAFNVIKAFSQSTSKSVKFVELNGYSRYELTCLMQAADVLIMCSTSEGSPQVIKEAILNTLPIVSNDVGDVREICSGVDNCFIVPKQLNEFVKHFKHISTKNLRIENREPVLIRFDNNIIAAKLFNIYNNVLNQDTTYINPDVNSANLKYCS